MDDSIERKFKQTNSKNLRENLLLNLYNNDNTLRLELLDKIKLKTTDILKKTNKKFKDYCIDYDVESLNSIIEKLKLELIEEMKIIIDERKERITREINKNYLSTINNMSIIIDDEALTLKSKLNILINKVIYDSLSNKIFSSYMFKNEIQKKEISKLLAKFDNDLKKNILDAVVFRNDSLKNNMNETIEKVEELNKKVKEMSLREKV